MKVLFVGSLFIEGQRDRGFSYEYYNLFQSLERLVGNISVFDFMEVQRQHGRKQMNQALLEKVKTCRPDVTIVVPYTDQFIPEVIDEINHHTTTVAYFFDDMWRIEYARFWAGHFTFITTSDVNGVRKFREAGYNNVIYSPFGCNHQIFLNRNLPKLYDISFVGLYNPLRAWYLQKLRQAGLDVKAWGQGWGTGHLQEDDMVVVFNKSRINLNLSNSICWDVRYLLSISRPIKETLRTWRSAWHALSQSDVKVREQVKGRHFEINACGGFQLTYYVEGLESHYKIGEEIALYSSPEELVEKAHYYLKHDDEREAIAQRGYARTMQEHTMDNRFGKLLERIRLMKLT